MKIELSLSVIIDGIPYTYNREYENGNNIPHLKSEIDHMCNNMKSEMMVQLDEVL